MRVIRLVELIILLVNKKDLTVKYLSDYFSVSRKTIYGDLEILVSSGIPINYGGSSKGYIEIIGEFDFAKNFISKQEDEVEDFSFYSKYIDNTKKMEHAQEMWKKLISKQEEEIVDIEPSIFNSWFRCLQNEVPAYQIKLDNLVTPNEIAKFDLYLNYANNHQGTKIFCEMIKILKWHAQIYDKECRLLHLINPVSDYNKFYPYIGYPFDANEGKLGTNAVALATLEKKTKVVIGKEHYNKRMHEISTVASPIYFNKDFVGTMNVIFPHHSINPRLKEIVTAITKQYEALVLDNYPIDFEIESLIHRSFDKPYLEKQKLDIKGVSKSWQDIIEIADAMSQLNQDIVLTGERGVGKEKIARYIHANSQRRGAPCIVLDGEEIEVEKQKRELFGEELETGSYLGAFGRASGGTVILTNYDKFSVEIRKQISKFLEKRKLRSIGSKRWKIFDIRVFICIDKPCSKDICNELNEKAPFLRISLPSLYSRIEDVEFIIAEEMDNYFKVNKFTKRMISEFIKETIQKEISGSLSGLMEYLKEKKKV